MSVLERSELEASPLADLHAIADQLGLEGFRRLRKAELIDAILGGSARGRATVAGTGESPGRRLGDAPPAKRMSPAAQDGGTLATAQAQAGRSRRSLRSRGAERRSARH